MFKVPEKGGALRRLHRRNAPDHRRANHPKRQLAFQLRVKTMSTYETPMTRRFHKRVGGTLYEEFYVGGRWLDGVIVCGPYQPPPKECPMSGERINLDGLDIIIVEAKARRLGRNLLGQAIGSAYFVNKYFAPRHVRNVVLCAVDDPELRPLFALHGIEVFVDHKAQIELQARRADRRLERRAA
jgi:hypothetical protein